MKATSCAVPALATTAAASDGTGLGITHIAVGSLRYRVTFKGPGGHSYGAFGLSNPMHALGRAVATMSQFEVPENPKTTFNVGRMGGGTSVNAIPFDAWFEMDLRSASPSALQALDHQNDGSRGSTGSRSSRGIVLKWGSSTSGTPMERNFWNLWNPWNLARWF